MRILVVDDHALVRESLAHRLRLEPDLEVVGEAWDGKLAVELAQELRPDVVLMDIGMPVLDGVQATRAIHAQCPEICIIGLSMFPHDQQGEALQAAGAMEYVTKSAPLAVLLTVLRGGYMRSRKELPPQAAA